MTFRGLRARTSVCHNRHKSDVDSVRTTPTRPYSVYTPREKWFIVSVAAFAALFSPLTANIYFPAIPTIATAFHKSTELINLTVTVYMIVQGISPMFWGTLGDRWGRRPMFMSCMLVLSASCVGLALVPTHAYWLLMVLRCVQAAGSASTIALGAGVISDIATPAERGSFFGMWNIGPMVGPCIGPVLGGVLADKLGWRSIFWFLCIAAAVCFIVMLLLLPETLRAMVGDGSIPPPSHYRPIIPIIGRGRVDTASTTERPPPRGFSNPLLLFRYPDVSMLLETDTGLCFLAIGGGMLIGSVVTGEVLDREYSAMRNKMIRANEKVADPEKRIRVEDITKEEHFPIEMARLRLMPFSFILFVGSTIGYGWCLDKGVSIAGPLILQIISKSKLQFLYRMSSLIPECTVGWTVISMMNMSQTLIVDLAPAHSSAITACVRVIFLCMICHSEPDFLWLEQPRAVLFGSGICLRHRPDSERTGDGLDVRPPNGPLHRLLPNHVFVMHYGPRWRAHRREKRQAAERA
ncbi:Quinidine resistance protein 1 [Grifola frondosa]|uniref:Quinidine resistance protein 1 n=1 Tax=Grifola frondosa TaxID=5627 RepID=A0A1C7LUP9_GRIFR|nr:Quinidine resistance protein 1 [Grifola frondosa]